MHFEKKRWMKLAGLKHDKSSSLNEQTSPEASQDLEAYFGDDLEEQRQRHDFGSRGIGGMGSEMVARTVEQTVEAFKKSLGSRRAEMHADKIEELRSAAYRLANQIFDDMSDID